MVGKVWLALNSAHSEFYVWISELFLAYFDLAILRFRIAWLRDLVRRSEVFLFNLPPSLSFLNFP